MLIKVMTTRNSERIISDVEAVDIHQHSYEFKTLKELQNTISFGPGVFHDTDITPHSVEYYDDDADTDIAASFLVKFIDYLKDGQWHRLAIRAFAYICNDRGQTISKAIAERDYPLTGSTTGSAG